VTSYEGYDRPVVALVPARGGSKGIPEKNLQELGGASLLARAIATAREARGIDVCVVSTDCDPIEVEASRLGTVVHHRPEALATDDSLVEDTIRDVIGWFTREFGVCPLQLVLLQPTSPFRLAADVERCVDELGRGADSAATVTEASLHPHRAFVVGQDGLAPFIPGVNPWLPRQALSPPALELTGGVYAFWVDRLPPYPSGVLFGRIGTVPVPRERALDIDSPIDLELARLLLQRADFGVGPT
jgi:CMP-N,N'-diacetyllegionaminic acid synthase